MWRTVRVTTAHTASPGKECGIRRRAAMTRPPTPSAASPTATAAAPNLPEKQARAAESLVGELQSPALRLDAGEAAGVFGRRHAAGRLDDPAVPLTGDGINFRRLMSPVIVRERHGAYPSAVVHCNMARDKRCVKR